VLLAKTTAAARAMSSMIAAGQLERRYEAVVKGRLAAATTLSHWLRKDTRNNQVHLIDAPLDPTAQPCPSNHKHTVTRVEPVVEFRALIGTCTIVNAWPITGRSHQIRAQLAAAGLPILGDPKYGVEAVALRRPLLHATGVRFTHPITQVPIDLNTPVPWTRPSLIKLRRKA
jgi:23S rRNA pseudouridine1911/1915/1917 synthase